MAHMLPADSAHSMLTCCTLCRRPLRGRIVESKNIPHIDIGHGQLEPLVRFICGSGVRA